MSTSGRSSSELQPDRPVPGHDERRPAPGGRTARPRPRSATRRSPATSCSNGTLITRPPSALDPVELRLRRVVGDDDRRRDAGLARRPGDALRHVPGARRDDAAGELARPRRLRIAFVAPRILNDADRLQVLELQPDVRCRAGGRAASGPPRRRSARARASISASGIKTRPSCPCRSPRRGATRYSAAARSSTARPSDSKTVISSSDCRPGADAGEHLAELGPDVPVGDRALGEREHVVAGLVLARLAAVGEERRARDRRRVELARVREARADRVDVRARLQPARARAPARRTA